MTLDQWNVCHKCGARATVNTTRGRVRYMVCQTPWCTGRWKVIFRPVEILARGNLS